jgi:hypothetical protein
MSCVLTAAMDTLRKLMSDHEEDKAIQHCDDFFNENSIDGEVWWQMAWFTLEVATNTNANDLNFFILKHIERAFVATKRPLDPEMEFELYKSLAGCYFERQDSKNFVTSAKEAMRVFNENAQFHSQYSYVSRIAYCGLEANLLVESEGALRAYLRSDNIEPPNRKHRKLMMIQLLSDVLVKKGQVDEANRLKAECFEDMVASYKTVRPHSRLQLPVFENWGADDLTHFIDTVYSNSAVTLSGSNVAFEKLSDLNAKFVVARESGQIETVNLIRQKHGSGSLEQVSLPEEDRLATFFFLRTHASLLGAMSSGLSGLVPESYCMMRSALENALYAFLIFTNKDAKAVWLARRIDDEDSRKAVRKLFRNPVMFEALKSHSVSVGDRAFELYELTIEDGGHPNASQFHKHAVQRNEVGAIGIGVNFLDPAHTPQCIESIVDVGQVCLDIFKLIYPRWVW